MANGDTGAALAADQAQILAAGTGFVADANDVGGNNIPNGGGAFVGTATTVATATSPIGLAMGSIPVTANPDIANGVGAGGGGRVTTAEATPRAPPTIITLLTCGTAKIGGVPAAHAGFYRRCRDSNPWFPACEQRLTKRRELTREYGERGREPCRVGLVSSSLRTWLLRP